MNSLHINSARLWQQMMDLASIGATPNGGVNRLALSEEDRIARDRFVTWFEEAGCSTTYDEMGNQFALRPGKNPDLAPVMIASHIDSQPTGGKFDGALGVMAGLEIVRTLNDHSISTERSLEIVSWTNEEGARFDPAMLGSGVYAGEFSLDYAYDRLDPNGKRLGDELSKIGYVGEPYRKEYYATFELHIEQGPILEIENKQVGVVTGVQGIRWYDLLISGQECHAGPTPMPYRRDPVQIALPLLKDIYALADTYAPEARLTIGYLHAKPATRNTVPGSLQISVDLRHPDADILGDMNEQLLELSQNEALELNEVWYSEPVIFDEKCVNLVEKACVDQNVSYRRMVSGAGHDAVYISRIAPTAMIFIPCKDGLSHNEKEYSKPEDVAAGTNVLLQAALACLNEK